MHHMSVVPPYRVSRRHYSGNKRYFAPRRFTNWPISGRLTASAADQAMTKSSTNSANPSNAAPSPDPMPAKKKSPPTVHPPSSAASSCPRKSHRSSTISVMKREFSTPISRSFMRSRRRFSTKRSYAISTDFPSISCCNSLIMCWNAGSSLTFRSGRAEGMGGRRRLTDGAKIVGSP